MARLEFRHSLRFCAPEIQYRAKRITPVMGVLGDGRHGGGRLCRAADCARPLALFWRLFGRPKVTRPAGRNPVRRRAESSRPTQRTALLSPPHPPQCAHWGTSPYPLCRFATSSLPLLAFGHFPLTGGIGPLTRGVPQGEGLRAATWGRPYEINANIRRGPRPARFACVKFCWNDLY